MHTNSTITIRVRAKYNLFDKKLLKDPFEDGDLAKKYKEEALGLVIKELANGKKRGVVALTTLQDAVDTIYTHSKDLELEAYFIVE